MFISLGGAPHTHRLIPENANRISISPKAGRFPSGLLSFHEHRGEKRLAKTVGNHRKTKCLQKSRQKEQKNPAYPLLNTLVKKINKFLTFSY